MKVLTLIFIVLLAFAYAESEECKLKGITSAKKIFKESCMLKAIKQKGVLPKCDLPIWKPVGKLCCKDCPKGYLTVGKLCIEKCPKGMIDAGEKCKKPEEYTRKGFTCEEKCKKEAEVKRCEKFDELFYPECKKGFHPVGCCLCVPDCPETPNTFVKKVIKRICKKPECKKDEVLFKGKCYPKCPKKFDGKGPICWAKECPKGRERCGFFCVKPGCDLCNRHTNKVLKEVGFLIRFLQPKSGSNFFVDKVEVKKHAKNKCKDLSPKKKAKCLKKINKLLKVIPNKKAGKWFKMEICPLKP
jgi:hypothetical protein